MHPDRIRKRPADLPRTPNLPDWGEARRTFSWSEARRALDGLPGGAGINIAHEAVDRHAAGPEAAHVALRCLAANGSFREITYGELRRLTARLANALRGLGLEPGQRVFGLAGRVPELAVTALATLKARGVFCPLFSAYGPVPTRARLALGEGRVLVTTPRLPRPLPPGRTGELVLRAGWPSMFRAYHGQEERYRRCFADGWYHRGDLARADEDGYLWFVGRADDVIRSAGHLVGPTEMEGVLLEHPGLLEAGVIGVPDPVAGEVVKAFVVVRPGRPADEALAREVRAHARRRLGAAIAPRQIEFREHLPKTRSGKIARRLVRARELGEAPGDLSAIQDAD